MNDFENEYDDSTECRDFSDCVDMLEWEWEIMGYKCINCGEYYLDLPEPNYEAFAQQSSESTTGEK